MCDVEIRSSSFWELRGKFPPELPELLDEVLTNNSNKIGGSGSEFVDDVMTCHMSHVMA